MKKPTAMTVLLYIATIQVGLHNAWCSEVTPEAHADLGLVVAQTDGVADNNETMSGVAMAMRSRPKVNKNRRGFTVEERSILVSTHNNYRKTSNASNMMYMYWDTGLEANAQEWAENCEVKHSPGQKRKKVQGTLEIFDQVGENIFASSGYPMPGSVISAFYNEIKVYDYDSHGCSGVCGHYTQVVWARSYALGCGVSYCPSRKNTIVVCQYAPAGNYRGVRPYLKGPKCSACGDKIAFSCVDNMCARYPLVGSGGPSAWPMQNKHYVAPTTTILLCVRLWLQH